MKNVRLGNTNWQASAVALGILRMAQLETKDATKAIETAFDSGIDYIDSADIYGAGHSETVFGEALKNSSVSRDDLFIQSKSGIFLDPVKSNKDTLVSTRYDFSKDYLLQSVDKILQRMQIDYLDSFLLHRPDPLMEVDEIAEAFDELETSGKVRHFGVSNFNPEQYKLVQSAIRQPLLFNQLQFSIVHSGMIDYGMHTNMTDLPSINHGGSLLEFSRRKDITIQTWSPFQGKNGTFINDENYSELNQKLAELADKYHASKNAIAVAWLLRVPVSLQVMIGTMEPEHIIDSASGADVNLTRQEWYDIYFAAGNDLP